ncbi:hypothetical protein M8C21_012588, partial [Ambrosia artemisiifolia]
MDDWNIARSIVGPSITRGVTVEIPKVSWDDIGGLQNLKANTLAGPPNIFVSTLAYVQRCLSSGVLQAKAIQVSLSILVLDE